MTDLNPPPAKYRWRFVFSKKSSIKYISHLDLSLAWERALRRAQIPLAYSHGFNPRPKIQFASGLPLGTTGTSEIMDVIVTGPLDPADIQARLKVALPPGLDLNTVQAIPLKSPTLQHLLRQAEYRVRVEIDCAPDILAERIRDLLAADKIIEIRRRRKKDEEIDLRPWLHALKLVSVLKGEAHLSMRLTAGQYGNLRPETVLKTLGLEDNWAEIERTRLIFEDDIAG